MTERLTADLLRQARAGSREALEDLLASVSARLLGLIRLRLGRDLRARLESRDILQNTLLKAFSHLDQLRQPNTAVLLAWLARIAENEIRDQVDYHAQARRAIQKEQPLDTAIAAGVDRQLRSQTSRLALSEEMLRLEKALEAVTAPHREIILLRKFDELSFEEIGRRLGKSPDACRMLLARALAAVTLKMKELT